MASPDANYPPSSAADTVSSQPPLISLFPSLSYSQGRRSSGPSYALPDPMVALQHSASSRRIIINRSASINGSFDAAWVPDPLSLEQRELLRIHSNSFQPSAPLSCVVLQRHTLPTSFPPPLSIIGSPQGESPASYAQSHTSSPSFVTPPLQQLASANVAHAPLRYTCHATISVTYTAMGPTNFGRPSWTVRLDVLETTMKRSNDTEGITKGPFTVYDFLVLEEEQPMDIAQRIVKLLEDRDFVWREICKAMCMCVRANWRIKVIRNSCGGCLAMAFWRCLHVFKPDRKDAVTIWADFIEDGEVRQWVFRDPGVSSLWQ